MGFNSGFKGLTATLQIQLFIILQYNYNILILNIETCRIQPAQMPVLQNFATPGTIPFVRCVGTRFFRSYGIKTDVYIHPPPYVRTTKN